MTSPPPSPLLSKTTLAASGLALVACFAALPAVTDGARVVFRPPWDRLAPEEAWFWLGTFFLLLPGCTALGAAARAPLDEAWRWARERAEAVSRGQSAGVAVLLALLASVLAQLLNQLVLRGLPVTDDEYAAQVGGRVWAGGRLLADVPAWFPAAPQLFLFARNGAYTSFDFPGVLGAWALSELTGSGTWVFSLLAGVGVVGIAVIANRRWGPGTAVAALGLALASPHFTLISLSSHAHVLSRGFLAAGLSTLLFVEQPRARHGVFGGLLLGLAGLCRPFEVALVATPAVLGLLLEAHHTARKSFVAGLLVSTLSMVAVLLALDLAMGDSLLPLRLAPNELMHPYAELFKPPFAFTEWPTRFGGNVTYNFLMSGIFLLGPVGLPLAVLGSGVDATHRRLALGAALGFLLGLLHDDRGIHALGPVHLTEVSVVLLILSVAGLRVVFARWTSAGFSWSAGPLAGYLVGLLLFTGGYAVAHAKQAHVQAAVYERVEGDAKRPTVVLAPRYSVVSSALDNGKTGTWVYSWRRAHPATSELVLVLHDSTEARQSVRGWFPERTPQVLEQHDGAWTVVPLELAQPLKGLGSWKPLRTGQPSSLGSPRREGPGGAGPE